MSQQEEQPPAWVLEMFQRQTRQMADMAAQQADQQRQAMADLVTHQANQQQQAMADLTAQQASTLARFEERISSYEEERGGVNVTPPFPPMPAAPTPATTTMSTDAVRKPRHSQDHPEKYDNQTPSQFPQFAGLLRAKLQIDGPAIGGETEKVWYAFGRLKGSAAERVFPWMSFASQQGSLTVDAFMDQLHTAFSDPRLKQKSLSQINRTKQGSRPFGEFIGEFDRLILEASGWGWEDDIKKGYLKAALSTKLITATVSIQERDTYEGYCQQLRMISDKLDEVAELNAWRNRKPKNFTHATTQGVRTNPDTMDWQPTATVQVAAAYAKEPRWASPEVIAQRRANRLCLRCGADGHMVRDCKTKLQFVKEKVRAAPVRQEKVVVVEEEEMSGPEDSGKE